MRSCASALRGQEVARPKIVKCALNGAPLNRNACAKLAYSEYCAPSTQTRYYEWDKAKKRLYKVCLPHRLSGYIAQAYLQ